ncbi:hypothetical protein VSR34_15470 [Paraburkholderia sp. JHI2823]|uniref:hypothetical protein n=1 Tax=Paraburkholderia sp. JHI2823 TaxID=3112960 RepID=UPI00317CEB30
MLIAGAARVAAQSLLVARMQVVRKQMALHLAVLAIAVLCWWFGNLTSIVTGDVLACVPSWLA